MAANDLDSAIEQSHAAGDAILKGDPSGYKTLYSDREDVTLGNPFGPYARGRKKVEETLDGAASHYRDGEFTPLDLIAKYASDDLACIVEVERGRAKVGGGEELVPVAATRRRNPSFTQPWCRPPAARNPTRRKRGIFGRLAGCAKDAARTPVLRRAMGPSGPGLVGRARRLQGRSRGGRRKLWEV